MRATILAMRLLIAAAFAALVVVVGGCGGTASTGSTADPALGSDAAQLVPPDALAFASIDTDQSSGQSRQLDELTRGLVEMARLGEACGAQPETFAGLAGMGDLIVTCFSAYGRNRRAGELISRGRTPDEAVHAAGREGDHVLRGGAELDADEVVVDIDAEDERVDGML